MSKKSVVDLCNGSLQLIHVETDDFDFDKGEVVEGLYSKYIVYPGKPGIEYQNKPLFLGTPFDDSLAVIVGWKHEVQYCITGLKEDINE